MIEFSYQQQLGEFKLDAVSDFPSTGVTILFGESGAGKTSLLRLMCGLTKVDSASLTIDGIVFDSRVKPWQRNIGYVSQKESLFPHMSVIKNLNYAEERSISEPRVWSKSELIQSFKISNLVNSYPSELSGGQTQRVAIVRALLSQPRLLILDEPVSALDEVARFEILNILRELMLNQQQTTLLYVTHDKREVAMIADHMLIMKDGTISSSDPYLKIASDLEHWYIHDGNIISILTVEYIGKNESKLIETRLGDEIIYLREQHNTLTRCKITNDQMIRIQILASEVSIHLQKNNQTSILNQIAVTITDLSNEVDGQQLVLFTTSVGKQAIIVSVTSYSVQSLNLKIGMMCFACFKAVALNF